MSLIDRLTVEEKDKIAKYIDENLGGKRTASVEKILTEWDYCKTNSSLAKMFKDNFILEREICYTETQLDIEKKLNKERCVHALCDALYNAIKDAVDYFWDRHKITLFAGAQMLSIGRLDKSYIEDYGNTLELKSVTKPPLKLRLQKGEKVIRILSKIVDYYDVDKDLFEQVRLAQSMAMNTKTLKGTMCLSIHPLDYMTMSDNNCDWNSCMSWQENGEYRQGTVEMMNSPFVVVAYLKSKNDMNLCWNGTAYEKWNNKKWRELFVVNEDCILNVKAYPFKSDELTLFCLNWLKELATKNIGWKYQNDYKKGDCSFLADEGYHFETNYMYNDITEDRYYRHFIYEGISHATEDKRTCINYSGAFTCMACGEVGKIIDDESGTLICVNCTPVICSCCGKYLFPDVDNIHFIGPYCEECYNNLNTDFVTGKKLHHLDFTSLYVVDRKNNELKAELFTLGNTLYYNPEKTVNCLKALHRCSEIKLNSFGSVNIDGSCYFVYEDELTEEGKERCKMYGKTSCGQKFAYDINYARAIMDIKSIREFHNWLDEVCPSKAEGIYIHNIALKK